MTAGAPWSVKGIDPKAREIAKDLARRSGLTLGEWLNQVILEDEAPVEEAPRYPTFGRHAAPTQRRYETYSRPVEDAFRVSDTLDRLSARIEAAEQRAAGAIGGIEQAVANLMARLDGSERDQNAIGARMEGAFDGLRAEQARAAERLRKIEQDSAESRTGEVLKAMEGVLAKVAGQVQEGQGQAAATFDGLRQELDGVYERLDGAFTEDAARELVETVVARLSARLEEAERRTADALHGMESAFSELETRLKTTEARLSSTETRLEDRSHDLKLEALAATLTEQMDAVRAEMAEAIRASAADGRFERMEQAVEEISGHVHTAEQRSAGAIEKMGHELLRMADTLTRTVQDSEQRSGDAIAKVADGVAETVASQIEAAEQRANQAIAQVSERFGGEVAHVAERFARSVEDVERRSTEAIERVGGEVARVADAMESRLTQADSVGAAALERLGGEIARITERLTERIANAERRSAQAIDDVGDQVARVTERLQDRQERASTDLAERIRLSEERTARLLDEARDRIDQRLAETQRRLAGTAPAPAAQPLAYEAYADPAVAPFGDDSYAAPASGLAGEAARLFGEAGTDRDLDFAPAADGPALAGDVDLPPAALAEPAAPDPALAEAADFADDAFIEPAQVEGEAQDFGAGLFAASEEPGVEDEDDWLSPALADEPHDLEAHAADAVQDDEAQAFEGHDFDDDTLEAHEAEAYGAGQAQPPHEADDEPGAAYGLAALASLDQPAGALEPEGDDDFAASDDFLSAEPMRPRTTRELVEQARAAARAASPGQDAKARGKEAKDAKGGSLFGGFGRGGKKKRGSTMRTALLVSGGTAAMGVALAGYVILSDKPHGALPERVAEALGVHAAQVAHPATGEVAPSPLAAVALTPKPIAGQMVAASQQAGQATLPTAAGPGGAELYNDAVRRIESKDKTGVAALLKSANLGYAPAQFYLAKLYEDGQAGLAKDLVEARRWTERAAEGGDRKAMHNLALYFFEGVGGPKNLTSAAEWFRRASDLGLVDSQYNLARLYEEGFGVAQNPAEAYKWYLIAGRSGDGESRMSALRIKGQLSAEAQRAAERAAEGFQAQAAQPIQAAAGADASSVAVAQRALAKLGFYQGPTDGTASPALKLAIAAYQRGQGLPASGELDQALNQRLATVMQK
jgi:localization factor PodJL